MELVPMTAFPEDFLQTIVNVQWGNGDGWVCVSTEFRGSSGGIDTVNGIIVNHNGAPGAGFTRTPFTPTKAFLDATAVGETFGLFAQGPDVNPPHATMTAAAIFFKIKKPDPFVINLSASVGEFYNINTWANRPGRALLVDRLLVFNTPTSVTPAFTPGGFDHQTLSLVGSTTRSVDPTTLLIS